MGQIEFIAIFGGLFYWPMFMLVYRRWSFRAKAVSVIFVTTLAAILGLRGAFTVIVHQFGPFDVEAVWPMQFLFPMVTVVSLLNSTVATFVFDDKGNVV